MDNDFLEQYLIEDPLVAAHLPIEDQQRNIEDFRQWLAEHSTEWFILPPATTYGADGRERMTFVLRQGDVMAGLFSSPFQALRRIGDSALTNNFYQYMRRLVP